MNFYKRFRSTSFKVYVFTLLFALFLTGLYYPKWEKKYTEATITWDIAGYYIYLPALFIYQDLKKLTFKGEVYAKYNPYIVTYESFTHPNGNEVIKYSAGMAIMYSPFFFAAHVIAKPLGYPADGYSLPYQFALSIGGLIMAFIGLYFLRSVLLHYYQDSIVAWVIFLIAIGTNYLEYATMHSPMTHGHIFMLVSILIWVTIKYYQQPTLPKALSLGLLIGLASLIRPTEFILLIIPLLWNIDSTNSFRHRITFLKNHKKHIIWAGLMTALIGSIQILYWLYVADDPLVYSYQNQGFKFFKPHIANGLFSYRKGWFIYTPIMLFSVLGFIHLYKKNRKLFTPLFIYTLIHVYITLSWDIWWYGGGLGQRALIHAYPALSFALAAFIVWTLNNKWYKYPLILLMLLCVYFNLWLTHQAHHGGLLETEAMTKKYFYKILGRYHVPYDTRKFLDTKEAYNGKIDQKELLHFQNYEKIKEPTNCNNMTPIQGRNSLCISSGLEHSEKIKITKEKITKSWIRVSADFYTNNKEWNVWNMAQITVAFVNDNEIIKSNKIRIQRHIDGANNVHLFFDTEVPDKYFDEMHVFVTNIYSQQSLLMDNLMIVQFD